VICTRRLALAAAIAAAGCGSDGSNRSTALPPPGGGGAGPALSAAGPTPLGPHDPIELTFDRAIDGATVSGAVSAVASGQAVAGTASVVAGASSAATFVPSAPWPVGVDVDVTVDTTLESAAGVAATTTATRTLATVAAVASLADAAYARTSAAAVALPDGRALLVGGKDAQDEAALFDPAGPTVQATGSLAEGRLSHRVVLLDDGKVAVIGGQTSGLPTDVVRTSIEVWDPATGQWTTSPATLAPRTGDFVVGRIASAGTVRWVLAGGYATLTPGATPQTAIEVLDAAMQTVSTSAATATLGGGGAQLDGGDLLLCGGDGARTRDVEVIALDPAQADPVASVDRFAGVLPLAGGQGAFFPTVAALDGDRALVAFEGTLNVVTVTYAGGAPSGATNAAGPAFGAGRAREFLPLAPLPDGSVFLGPGKDTAGSDGLGLLDVFVPGAAGAGGTLAPLGAVRPRRVHLVVALADGRPAIVGGREGGFGSPAVGTADVVPLERALEPAVTAAGAACVLGVAPAPTAVGGRLPAGATELRFAFSGGVDSASVTNQSVEVRVNGAPIAVTVTRPGRRTLVVDLGAPGLAAGDALTAEVQPGLLDAAGRAVDLSVGAPSATWEVR